MTTSIAYQYSQDNAGRPNRYSQVTVNELTDMINKHLTWQTEPFQHEHQTSYCLQSTEALIKERMGTKVPKSNSQNWTSRAHGKVGNLVEMIDEHLATQLDAFQYKRPTSAGTMFVDWDGICEQQIKYRNHQVAEQYNSATEPPSQDFLSFNTALALKPLPPLPSKANKQETLTVIQENQSHPPNVPGPRKHLSSMRNQPPSEAPQFTSPDDLQTTYHPTRHSKLSGIIRPAYVAGYDPSTAYSYDYNGRIMHIHRDEIHREAEERLSMCSEYYAVDAEEYNPHVSLVLEPLARSPAEQKKRDRVVGFVQKLLRQLDGLGIMKKLREERMRVRCGGR